MVQESHSVTAFAKTTQPALGSVVVREALFARLDTPAGRSVVWISGPPGAGKTTLAASYVEARRLRSVWFQVDADDADPATFFHYLHHAVRRHGGARAPELPAFTAQHNDDVASFARRFFRQLFARVTPPFALVIDNLQSIPDESALHGALAAALDEVAKNCCVIVTSRREPPAALARLRAAGRMCCLTGSELALGPDDVLAVAQARGQSISPEAAARLHERTQGWAAGLVLLLEHSRFSGRVAELPGDATPQVIFDYLAGEIFDRFDARTREFLLRVACLPRMTAAVAQALSGEANAARLLVNLALNDYFVREAAGDGGRVYQFHPLLRDFLRHRAAQALPEAVDGAMLTRAARLLQQTGQTEDAVALLIEAADWHAVAEMIVTDGDTLLAQGRSETLAGWLDLLPPERRDADPRLLRICAAARTHASPRAAHQLYERAFNGFQKQQDHSGTVGCACGVLRTVVLEFDDLTPLDRWIDTLDSLLAPTGSPVAGTIDVAATTLLIRAMLLRDAGNPRLDVWLDALATIAAGDARHADVDLTRAWVALARGDFAVADAILDETVAPAPAAPTECRLALALARSVRHLLVGDFARAERAACDALAVAGDEGLHFLDAWLTLTAVVARLYAGDGVGAQGELQRRDWAGARRGDRAGLHYVRGWIAVQAGDVVTAGREARTALAVAVETGVPWLECLARSALAQLATGGDDRHFAEAQLRSMQAIAERLHSPWLQCGANLVAATLAREVHDKAATAAALRSGLRVGRERGLWPPPSWPPHALGDLCVSALREDVEPEYTRSLVRAGGLAPTSPPLRVRLWPWPFRIATFGGFRLRRGETLVEYSGKGPGRPLELLKVLIALGGHDVRADQLADALWPHMEADYAHKSFTATLHRLRRMLEDDDALILSDGRLSLDQARVWLDTSALAQVFDNAEAEMRSAGGDIRPLASELVDEAIAFYRGPFLPDESEQPGYIACREQFRARLLRFLARIAHALEQAGAPAAAAECYARFIEVDELCEPLYRSRMLCLHRNGDTLEAVATYERLRAVLSARTKTMPSAETQALYASLKAPGNAAALA